MICGETCTHHNNTVRKTRHAFTSTSSFILIQIQLYLKLSYNA